VSVGVSAPASPYKGLAAFGDSELDALFFFGREREREVIAANLLASRLTVLYGESGVGKSSLLAAGVARELRARTRGAVVALHDTWSGPFADALERVRGAEEGYLILDQFEEYFLYFGDDDRPGTLLHDLPLLLEESRVNVLVSLREDSLAQLDAFKARIPSVFANQIRLEHLDRESARAAILGPVQRWSELTGEHVEIEPALVDGVLDEVAAGRVEGRPHDRDRIEAPYLQLVLERIWETERAEASSFLRVATLQALGGAATIVREHLRGALASLTPGEQDVAAEMFEHLVTPSGTKIAHRAQDLAQYADVPEPALLRVLGTLTRERIVHSVDGSDRYEIFHDVLTEPIQAWRQNRRLERERAEAGRRQRRLAALALFSAVALAVVTAIALFALAQRSHARAQARHARAGELAATALADINTDPVRSLQRALSAARIERSARVADVLRTALLETHLRLVLPAQGAVSAVAFSRDSRRALVGAADGRVSVYDVKSARRLLLLRVPGGVAAASFSPDGRTILAAGKSGRALLVAATGRRIVLRHPHLVDASCGDGGSEVVTAGGGSARLWDVTDGRLLQTFVPGGNVSQVALSPNGDRVAMAWSGPSGVDHVDLVDAHSGTQLGDLRGTTVTFSPDDRLLATGDPDQFARLYSADGGTLVWRLPHGGAVTSVDFRSDSSQLATASADGGLRVWDVRTGNRVLLMPSGTTTVEVVRYSRDGRFLVSGEEGGATRVWNSKNSRELVTLGGHRGAVTGVAFSPNGRFVITASDDSTARIWEPGLANQLRLVGRTHAPIVRAGFAGGDGRAFAGARDGVVRLWRIGSRRAVLSLRAPGRLADAAASPNGAFLAGITETGVLQVWDARGRSVLTVHLPGRGGRVMFAPGSGELLAAAGHVLRLIDVASRRTLRTARIRGRVTDAVVARGGVAVAGTSTGRVVVWTRGAAHVFEGGTQPVAAVALSPDGNLVAAASRDGVARVWSRRSGRLQHALQRARTALTSVAFSHDGRFLATAAIGGDARLWTVVDGRPVHILRAHTGRVASVAFSPNDAWLLTAGPTSIGLWQTSSGRLLFYLRGHTAQVENALFGTDGKRILSASADGTVRVYDCEVCGTVYELAHLARVRLSHVSVDLTIRERRRYLGG
jgi:WD40 repeat protein